jgi:hypothetical protein
MNETVIKTGLLAVCVICWTASVLLHGPAELSTSLGTLVVYIGGELGVRKTIGGGTSSK